MLIFGCKCGYSAYFVDKKCIQETAVTLLRMVCHDAEDCQDYFLQDSVI